jgi:amino acid transporter
MARAGAMPKALAKVHPRYKTPVNAIYLQTLVTLFVGIVLAAIIHPGNVYNVTGLMFTFTLIPVFIAANVGLFRFYRREHPGEFKPLLHVVCPLVSSAALLYVGYASLVPAPSFPNNWAAPIVGIWLVIGIGVVFTMKATGRTEWLLKAGAAVGDSVPDEAAVEEPGIAAVEGRGAR